MNHYDMPVDIDLSNDYGLGMLLMFVCGASLFIALPFVVFGAWRLAGRLQRIVLANPLFQRTASGGR